jgi:transcriptional regulatory protein LevR
MNRRTYVSQYWNRQGGEEKHFVFLVITGRGTTEKMKKFISWQNNRLKSIQFSKQ